MENSTEFLTFFKEHVLSKEKNQALYIEKVKAAFMCSRAPNIIWTYFDLETSNSESTDVNIRNGTIIEIGAVHGEKVFSQLCNPGHSITNSHIHNIKDTDVSDKNSTEKVLGDFLAWSQSLKESDDDIVVLIAHNAANFDKKVLVNHIRKYKIVKDLDGIVIADSLYPIKGLVESKQAKLEIVYKELFTQEYIEKHRALDDSKDLMRIIEHLSSVKKKSLFEMLSNYMYLLH